jgi:hypothetical protein
MEDGGAAEVSAQGAEIPCAGRMEAALAAVLQLATGALGADPTLVRLAEERARTAVSGSWPPPGLDRAGHAPDRSCATIRCTPPTPRCRDGRRRIT